MQTSRLRSMVDRLLAVDGGLQGERLRAAGVTTGAELTLDDLPRLPVVTKPDLWEGYPFGLLSVPIEQCVTVHGSSGTSGRPTLVAYTAADMDIWADVVARGLVGAGATPRSMIHNAYGYGLFTGGLGIHHGARALGATVVPMSGGQTARQLRLIQDLQPDVLTCTPSYAIYLGEAARAEGIDPATLSLRVGVHGAEPWTDAMRAQIEAAARHPGAGHLRPVRDHRPGRGLRDARLGRLAARSGGPFPGRGAGSGRAAGAGRRTRRADVHHADQGGAAAAAVPHR